MDNIYKNIKEYNPNKKCKILIVFDDMIADMLSNKNLNPTVTELFTRGRKLNISFVFITQSFFAVPKTDTLKTSSRHLEDMSCRRLEDVLETNKMVTGDICI